MTIAVLFAVGAGGWFFGVVSAFLLYRVMERVHETADEPDPETADEPDPGEQWRRYDSVTCRPGDMLPGLNVRLTEDGCELVPEPPSLELVR